MKIVILHKNRLINGKPARAGVPTAVDDHTAMQIEQSRWGTIDKFASAKAAEQAAKAIAAEEAAAKAEEAKAVAAAKAAAEKADKLTT